MGRRKPPADFSPAVAAPVTADSLKRLFWQRQIVRAGKLPSAEGFADLAYAINTLRFRKHMASIFHDMQRQPVRVMPDALPLDEVQAEMLDIASYAACRQWPRRRREMEARTAAIAASARSDRWHGLTTVLIEGWHDFAAWLAERFRVTMRTTNPCLEGGLSNAMLRFLAAAIPLITGETPPETTIRQYLHRSTRNMGGQSCS